MKISEFVARCLRKIIRIFYKNEWWDESNVELYGQQANDYLKVAIINNKNGLMVTKFGTIELNAVCCCKRQKQGYRISDYKDYIFGKGCIYPNESIKALNINAGFFPIDLQLQNEYTQLVLNDTKDIDILGSYVNQESYLKQELEHCKKIDIYGYCAPFAWNNPWTEALEGKKVLVVHPFTESIKKQYEKRKYLFEDERVLPEFKELILVKAVQSIADNGKNTGFDTWFDALKYMEKEIDSKDYDIALIGCGAYGMNLAAHCKRNGKIAIHMASWVQMLFGIYGDRWVNQQPEYKNLINKYWVRPMESERPNGVEKVENAAYW